MQFRILGPLEVIDGDRPVPVGGPRQRAVLALLLTRPNEAISTDRLIDELWGAEPPATAANTVQYYVSQLRKLLGADRIVTRAPGYLIRVEPGELDLQRFEQLLRRDDAESLAEALALWRGLALADFAYEPFAQGEIARLEELRVVAFEKRIDADLESGRHVELVAELERLVAQHPLRERLRAQLMLALYRSGRQAEALAAYQAARGALVEELGIEPGPPLQELERAILRQDPSLEVTTEPALSRPRRAILVAPSDARSLEPLLTIAETLARRPSRELIVAGLVDGPGALGTTNALLAQRREELAGRSIQARVVAYTSTSPGEDLVQLATQQDVDLVLLDSSSPLERGGAGSGPVDAVLRSAPCDVGVLVNAEPLSLDPPRPVVVPFGGVEHDWSAVELAAWLARSLETTLRLAGTEADAEGRRDASRLLGSASLVVQAAVGVVAEPALVPRGAEGVLEAAADASILVVGLSDRWRTEGVGEARLALARTAPVPMLLVRHGLRPGGLAPAETMTRFTWTLAKT